MTEPGDEEFDEFVICEVHDVEHLADEPCSCCLADSEYFECQDHEAYD